MADKAVNLDMMIEQAKREYDQILSRKQFLEQILSAVGGIARPKVEKVQDFSNWTIPAAAKQLILEAGGPLTTRQILDEMLKRGWTTKSERAITVIHSGLKESPYIKRVGKRWDVSQRGLETEI